MDRHEAWHSLAENVHHEHPECMRGARAASTPGVVRPGEGGRPLCETCVQLLARDAACHRQSC